MPSNLSTRTGRYAKQRPQRTPPHVSLRDLRIAVGLTIDQVLARLEIQTDRKYSRGTISAIENGHRGASADLLVELALVYGLRPDAITTDYQPREWTTAS